MSRSTNADPCRRPTIRRRVPTAMRMPYVSCRCSHQWVALWRPHRLRRHAPVADAVRVADVRIDGTSTDGNSILPPDDAGEGRVGWSHGFLDRDHRGDGSRHRCGCASTRCAPEADPGASSAGASTLTLYVDGSHWWFRDRRWCHLVSDTSVDELHDFAARLGMSERAFHGDHYDLPDEYRPRAIAAGAHEVGSRDIVRILRDTGLRRRVGVDQRPHVVR